MKLQGWLVVANVGLVGCAGLSGQPEMPLSQVGTVVGVSDGETMTVWLEGREQRLRLCGIDAPERTEPLGQQSGDTLRRMIAAAGDRVMVTPVGTDGEGVLVGEVFVKAPTPEQPEQELLLNYEQVNAGMAYVYRQYLDGCPSKDVLLEAEKAAQQAKRGGWSKPNLVKPWDFRKQQRGRS